MKEPIDKIRAELDELAKNLPSGESERVLREFSAFDLPEIIEDTRFTATLDHVKPISEGGDNGYENLMMACLSCNSKKTGKTLGGFLADRGRA